MDIWRERINQRLKGRLKNLTYSFKRVYLSKYIKQNFIQFQQIKKILWIKFISICILLLTLTFSTYTCLLKAREYVNDSPYSQTTYLYIAVQISPVFPEIVGVDCLTCVIHEVKFVWPKRFIWNGLGSSMWLTRNKKTGLLTEFTSFIEVSLIANNAKITW